MRANLNIKYIILSIVFFCLSTNLSAYDYTIGFTGSGASSNVDKVLVLNLTRGTTTTVPSGAVLHLTDVTAVNALSRTDENLRIYPNPIQTNATVSFNVSKGGVTQISIYSIEGRIILRKSLRLEVGINQFQLTVPIGVYTLQINENGKLHNARLISQNPDNKIEFEFKGSSSATTVKLQKLKSESIILNYQTGDILLFKGYSGNCTTIVTDIITDSKTENFNFVECKDGDGNYYPTVTIGNQTWMAENLKTTHYRNAVEIPNKTDDSNWGNLTSDAYSEYNSAIATSTYGKLYNWYAATSNNNIAPSGWHVPSNIDWRLLTDYLSGSSNAGSKLKETGLSNWINGNTDATNTSGFTALPGGTKGTDGRINSVGSSASWWTISESPLNTWASWCRQIYNNSKSIDETFLIKSTGATIRCLYGEKNDIYNKLKLGYSDITGIHYRFTNYIKLIDDLGLAEVLKTWTGKVVFASDDTAFDRFYLSNKWGVKSYNDLTLSQKKKLLNSSIIFDERPIDYLSNIASPTISNPLILRRKTIQMVEDSICFDKKENLPIYNKNWDIHRESGYYTAKDNTAALMLHFTQKNMDYTHITDEDFSVLYNGASRTKDDVHIFGNKVIVKDITCTNGYIHIVQDLIIPPSNMSDELQQMPEAKIFSSILERFTAPFYDAQLTYNYRKLHPEFKDTIFVKKYFSEKSSVGSNLINPTNNKKEVAYLAFDPGWNTYSPISNETDMGVIFVPTDVAMNDYFTKGGKFLVDKYGSIENIPNDKLDDLINNHMKTSFIASLPSKFPTVLDDAQNPMGITKSDVNKCIVANNGVVYITNKVYLPAAYASVMAPVLVNDNLKVFNWAVKTLGYDAYLLSMNSRYSFIVPNDVTLPTDTKMGAGMYYVDPVSLGKPQPEIFKFVYNPNSNTVTGAAFKYNPDTKAIGDSIRILTNAIILDRMEDMLDNHIVVGNIEDGKEFYTTKGGGTIRINKNGTNLSIKGAGNIETASTPQVTTIYDQTKATNGRGNGKTYVIDSPLMPSTKSVYKILGEEPQFSEFYKLLLGNDQATITEQKKYGIFYMDATQIGLDYNIKFFSSYNYTVYAPTNAAILDAINNGLPTWDMIKAQTDQATKDAMTEKLVNFLRYHFQDKSIYIDGTSSGTSSNLTAAYHTTVRWEYTYNDDGSKKDSTSTSIKIFHKLYSKLTPTGLSVASSLTNLSNGNAVNVTQNAGLVHPKLNNIMAREYKFNNKYIGYVSAIETSSYAVIHQIDKVLIYP